MKRQHSEFISVRLLDKEIEKPECEVRDRSRRYFGSINSGINMNAALARAGYILIAISPMIQGTHFSWQHPEKYTQRYTQQ